MIYKNRLAPDFWNQAMYPAVPVQPVNMLAQSQDFDPNSIVGRMLAEQRRVEALKAAQAAQAQKGKVKPKRPYGLEPADETLRRRMREAGVE